MGIAAFVKSLFEPTPEQVEARKQRKMRDVLVVMRKRYLAGSDDIPSFKTISRGLGRDGHYMPMTDQSETMKALVADGLVQRMDGGNKQLPETVMHYVINENGLNHLVRHED